MGKQPKAPAKGKETGATSDSLRLKLEPPKRAARATVSTTDLAAVAAKVCPKRAA